MYTGKRRSFKVTPGKLEELRVSLVEMRETPAKGGETPEKRGEPREQEAVISLFSLVFAYYLLFAVQIEVISRVRVLFWL